MTTKVKNTIIIVITIITIVGLAEITKLNKNTNLLSKSENEVVEEPVEDKRVEEDIKEPEVELEPEVPVKEDVEPIYDPDIDILKRIESYLGEEKKNVGFIYYNLITNEKISFNETLTMEAASTYKVGLNLVCYDLINKGKISLDDEVFYDESQYQEGAGQLQFEEELVSLPLRTLLNYSIIQSDNIAATMAYDYIGGWNSYRSKLFSLVGIENGNYKNITSAEDEFKVLKYLYDNKENQYYAQLLSNMKQTYFHERLDKLLPYEIVAHKIGDLDYAAHDMGIVFTEEPYIIIMLTDGVEGAYDKIAEISKAIYEYNNNER